MARASSQGSSRPGGPRGSTTTRICRARSPPRRAPPVEVRRGRADRGGRKRLGDGRRRRRRRARQALPGFAGSYTGRIVGTRASRRPEVEAGWPRSPSSSRRRSRSAGQRRPAAAGRGAGGAAPRGHARRGGRPPDEIFTAVAEEVASILGLPRIEMVRYEADGSGTVIGASGDHPFPAGSSWALDGPSIMGQSSRRAARLGSTTTTRCPARSPRWPARRDSGRRSARRSSSTVAPGARSSRSRRCRSRSPSARKSG